MTPKSSQVDVLPLGTDFIQPPVGQKPPLNQLELFNVVRELNYDKIRDYLNSGYSINPEVGGISLLGMTIDALSYSSEKKNNDLLERLIKDGADINQKDSDGKAPLHYAINTKNLAAIKFLMSKKVDTQILYTSPDTGEQTLLAYATSRFKIEKNTAKLFNYSKDFLDEQSKKHKAILEILRTDFIKPPVGQKPPLNRLELFDVVHELKYDKIRDYLNSGYSINPEVGGISLLGMTIDALSYSSEKKNNDLLERLIKDGADINQKDSDGKAPLHYAISTKNLAAIKFLMSKKVDTQILYTSPDTGEQTLLAYATSSFKIEKNTAKLFNYSKDFLDEQSKKHKAILEILRTANPADLSI